MTLQQPLFSVLPRSRASSALLLACLALATTATTILAAVPIYADAIEQAGFRRSLADTHPRDRGIEATVRTETSQWADVAASIESAASRRLPGDLRTIAIAETDSFGFTEDRYEEGTITSIASVVSEEAVLTFVDGSVDTVTSGDDVPVWLSSAAADALDLEVGDHVVLDGRAAGPVRVELVAIFEPSDRLDELWFDEPDVVDAVQVTGSFTEIGPFVTDTASLGRLDRSMTGSWRGIVVPASVTTNDLDEMRRGAQGMARAVRDELDDDGVKVETGLPGLLESTDVAVAATVSVIAVILVQLVGLALYGLSFAATVLASTRLGEAALLRSRGATAAQTGALATAEALLLVVPAVIAGPAIARAAIGLLERWGPVAASGLDLETRISGVSVTASIVVGIIAIGVIAWPAVRSMQALADARSETTRATTPGILQRTGADIAIAVVAVVALWKLTRSSAATRELSGRLAPDPVLIFAPALGVLAASLVTLRLVRIVARSAQSRAASGTGLSAALAGWEITRRPARTTRTSVLIVLSVTVGVFAAVLGSSWEQSWRDQADAAVSADVRVVPEHRVATAIAPELQAGAYAGAPGVTSVVPIGWPRVSITTDLDRVVTVATDTRRIGPLLRARSDLVGDRADLEALHAPADLRAVPLGDAGDLTVDVTLGRSGGAASGGIEIAVLIVDGFGTIHRLESTRIDIADSTSSHTLRFPLTTDAVTGFDAGASGPFSLLQVELAAPVADADGNDGDPMSPARFDIVLSGFSLGGEPLTLADRSWSASMGGSALTVAPVVSMRSSEEGLDILLETGLSARSGERARAVISTSPLDGPAVPGSAVIPALVTHGLLDALGLQVGDSAAARIDGTDVNLRIDGVVAGVPFAVDEAEAMIVDWPTVESTRYLAGGRISAPSEWAITVDTDEASALAAALRAEPFVSAEVADRRALARQLSDDPLAVGLLGGLGIAMATSMLVAVVGLMLTAVVGARERRSSYAVLTAMGAPTGVLRRWLVLEVVPLVTVSAIAGLAAGMLLARVTLETLTLASDGASVIPPPTLAIPWAFLGLLVGVALAAGVALALVTGRMLGRHRAADDLRIGDPS